MRGRAAILVHERQRRVRAEDGRSLYVVRVYAAKERAGTWSGWLEFAGGSGPAEESLRTGGETTQASIDAVRYWAEGLGTEFLRGALARARRRGGAGPRDEPVLVREHVDVEVLGPDGVPYQPRTYAREERPSTWLGWVEFHPLRRRAAILRTGSETSQPNRRAVEYWAEGLQPIYFDGAFARALRAWRRGSGGV